MILSRFTIKGSLMLIIGFLTISLAFVYLYYYKINEIITKENQNTVKVYGPTSLLIVTLIINIALLVLSISLSIIYGKSCIIEKQADIEIKNLCPNILVQLKDAISKSS